MQIGGNAQIFEGNPYEQHTDSRHQYGAKMFAANGDIYRYTKGASTDFVAGLLYVALANEANHHNITVAASNSIGDTSVVLDVGATAVDANEYDQGWLAFNDNSPEGEIYQITSHGTGTSAEVTFNVDPALLTATTLDSSEATLVRCPWNGPAISQLITEVAAGVAIVDWDVSVAEFGWLKTRGMAAVLADSTGTTVGYPVVISNEDNGAVGASAGNETEVHIGQAMDAGTDTEYNPVYLTID